MGERGRGCKRRGGDGEKEQGGEKGNTGDGESWEPFWDSTCPHLRDTALTRLLRWTERQWGDEGGVVALVSRTQTTSPSNMNLHCRFLRLGSELERDPRDLFLEESCLLWLWGPTSDLLSSGAWLPSWLPFLLFVSRPIFCN
jgi:hypothetical protein